MAAARIPLTDLHPERIALIKPSALGDIVHSLPLLSALRRRFPSAHITWVVNWNYAELLQGHPELDEIIAFDRRAARLGWLQAIDYCHQFYHRLRRGSFDLAIDLQGLLRSGLMTFATRAPRRIGLNSAREGARWFYTDRVVVSHFETTHAVDRYWLVAEALGAGDGPKSFIVPIADDAHRWANQTLADLPRPWLMVGVGARWETKRWPPEHFATLIHRAQDRFGGTAVFVGGKDETEPARKAARRLRGNSCDLTGKTTLPQLAAVLARADVMVANDTGPLHLAVALGRPAVAPYTCTKVQRTGPYGALHQGVESRVSCQGSYLKRCSRLDCMSELTPYRLWPILNEALQPWQRNQSA